MNEREDYPEDVKARMASLVSESQIRSDVKNITAATSDKRVRPKAVKAAKYKRKGI